MSWITLLSSHSCGGTLQNLDIKLYRNGLTYRHSFFIVWYSRIILVFPHLCDHVCEFRMKSPPTGHWIQMGYINFAIFCQIRHQRCHKRFFPREKLTPREIYACSRGRHHVFPPRWTPQWKFTAFTLCALLTRDLLAIVEFLVVKSDFFRGGHIPKFCPGPTFLLDLTIKGYTHVHIV